VTPENSKTQSWVKKNGIGSARQESLANAKVSARQQRVWEGP